MSVSEESKKRKPWLGVIDDRDQKDFTNSDSSASKCNEVYSVDNHLYYYTDVTRHSVREFIKEFNKITERNYSLMQRLNIYEIPIYIHINSFGGSLFAVFSAVDVIRSSNLPTISVVEGCAASAATLMSIVCSERLIAPSAYMLIHQLSYETKGKYMEMEDEMVSMKKMMDQFKEYYMIYANIPKKKLDEILKHDIWFTSKECLAYGLVDKVTNVNYFHAGKIEAYRNKKQRTDSHKSF